MAAISFKWNNNVRKNGYWLLLGLLPLGHRVMRPPLSRLLISSRISEKHAVQNLMDFQRPK